MFKLRSGPRLDLTIFFATDIHGSDVCFRKILAAPDFYKADVVVLGGDLTGKMIVPVLKAHDGWEARYLSFFRSCSTSARARKYCAYSRV